MKSQTLLMVLVVVVAGIAHSESSTIPKPKGWPIIFPPDFEKNFLEYVYRYRALQFPEWIRNNTLDPTPPVDHSEKGITGDLFYGKWTSTNEQMFGYDTKGEDFNVTVVNADLSTYTISIELNYTGEVSLKGNYEADGFLRGGKNPHAAFSGSGNWSVTYRGSFTERMLFTWVVLDDNFNIGDRPISFSSNIHFDAANTYFEGLWDDLDPHYQNDIRKTLTRDVSTRYASWYKGHPVGDLLAQCIQEFFENPSFSGFMNQL